MSNTEKEYNADIKNSAGYRVSYGRNKVQGSTSAYAPDPKNQPKPPPPPLPEQKCGSNDEYKNGKCCSVSGGRTLRRRRRSQKTHSKGGRSRKCRRKNKKSQNKSQSRPHSKQ